MSVVTELGVTLEETFVNNGMNSRKMLVHMDFYCEVSWIRFLGEVWKNHIVDQWEERINIQITR